MFWFGSLVILLSLSLVGCGTDSHSRVVRLAGGTMGTSYHITLVPGEQPVNEAQLQQGVDQLLDALNQQMSTYIPDSELMRFNRAPVGEWFPVSHQLISVLAVSADIHQQSQGSFDITVGPLVELWGFGARKGADQVPDTAEIQSLLALIGADKLEIDLSQAKVRKLGEIHLDLSAVAKGYGADVVSDYLADQGFDNTLVEIGGELRLRGNSPRGTPWKIGVEAPQLAQGSTQKAISVSGVGVATSGDYRNYFEVDGRRFSHTLDPRTGYPVTHKLASVTVVAATAAEADAWATALSVLGPERAKTIVEEKNLAAFFIIRAGEGFEEAYSSAFTPYLSPQPSGNQTP